MKNLKKFAALLLAGAMALLMLTACGGGGGGGSVNNPEEQKVLSLIKDQTFPRSVAAKLPSGAFLCRLAGERPRPLFAL